MSGTDADEDEEEGGSGLHTAADMTEAVGYGGCCLLELFAAASVFVAFLAIPAALWAR